MPYILMPSPLGTLCIEEKDNAITRLLFQNEIEPSMQTAPTPLLEEAQKQLSGYFAGERKAFSLPLAPKGTPFQQTVWQALLAIPYGETRSYAEIARAVEKPKAFRAVGMANNRNPIPILIPCHRVIGADGSLVGYGGGLSVKQALLALERKFA
ncbi:MAG TPA: methylated-DNA--[protein]-cysteine S-methyltransferase [Clostridiales bacterium]|nr:methylated-DNA--[protein]-cysteine S-methyltransferase [Clostridiales bacterium]